MKKFLLSCFILVAVFTAAQDKLQNHSSAVMVEIENVKAENRSLQSDLRKLKMDLKESEEKITLMQAANDSLKSDITEIKGSIDQKISDFDKKNQGKFIEVSDTISKNFIYSIVGALGFLIFTGILYRLLRKNQKSVKEQLVNKLNVTRSSIEEKLVKEFEKQTTMMESQIELLEKQKTDNFESSQLEPDHSLALKLAGEINLMERNISFMDPSVKGIKQLNRSLEKLRDNLAANGYEIPQLLGRQYHQGMKVIVASSIPDENLEKGSEIISKILIPQVNYNDKMIQTGQIEVSVGY